MQVQLSVYLRTAAPNDLEAVQGSLRLLTTDAKGTGAPGSEKELEIRWFMNREFRLALLNNWQTQSPATVIDFTRYDLPAKEPQALQREWSLMNVINQKATRPGNKVTHISTIVFL